MTENTDLEEIFQEDNDFLNEQMCRALTQEIMDVLIKNAPHPMMSLNALVNCMSNIAYNVEASIGEYLQFVSNNYVAVSEQIRKRNEKSKELP